MMAEAALPMSAELSRWATLPAAFALIFVIDHLVAKPYWKARWFALHVIANAWISLLCLPDLYAIATDPIAALVERYTVNHWPTSLIFSVHLYHMLFFRNLQFIDWLHHILMVVIGAPLLVTGEVAPPPTTTTPYRPTSS